MTYLDCSAHDCCHNKGGACCLGCIDVQHTGEARAVCGSYCSNESYANAATDNAPGTAETDIRCNDEACRHLCNDEACRHLKHQMCAARRVRIDESTTGPACLTRSEAK